jgi:hypothetical protein
MRSAVKAAVKAAVEQNEGCVVEFLTLLQFDQHATANSCVA